MKVLVAYQSQTGNTKKVADAIYDVIPHPKEIKQIKDITTLEGYDIAFLGFPINGSGPNKKAQEFLETCVKDRKIALFITHMAPEEAHELPEWIQKFKDAAKGANCVGVFDCQGQISPMVKTVMRFAPNKHVREWARLDNSKGQPDAARLERAKAFAGEIIKKL